ncbi:MAG: DUF4214 domain-containing protein [Thiovulaceae bacterium]|nr:DUF4214 domain-containing protein [Sulfurimonadaceae bacterium]
MVTNQQVAELYVATFNRAPDADGLDYWVNLSGLTIDQIAQSFFDQPETQALYPSGNTDAEFVTSIYTNLFNRAPDADGLAYWEAELSNGHLTRPVMIQAMKNGALGADAVLIANKATVGLYYASLGLQGTDLSLANVTGLQSSVVLAEAHIDNILANGGDTSATGQTLTLTTSATDNILGTDSNDLILGQTTDSMQPTEANTLNASDVIDGGAGVDTLRVTASGVAPSVTGFTMTNVENMDVRSYAATGVTLGLVNVTGLEKVISTTSTGDITLNQVQNIVDLDLTGSGAGAIAVAVNYATDVVTGTADVQNITVDRFQGGVSVNGVETVNLTANNRASDMMSDGSLSGDSIANVIIDGTATSLSLDVVGGGEDSAIHSIDASGFAGDLTASATLDTDTDAVVTTVGGNDTLDLTVIGSGTATIDAGAGNNDITVTEHGAVANIAVTTLGGDDTINVRSLEYAQTSVTVNAGAGANTVNVATDTPWSYANDVNITTLGGDDVINVGKTNTLTIDAGNGDNTISAGDVMGAGMMPFSLVLPVDATITTGTGNDDVTVGSVENGALVVALGEGVNSLSTGTVLDATVTAGNGANDVTIDDLYYNAALNITLGDGGNNVTLNHADSGGSDIHITTGAGADTIDLTSFYGYNTNDYENGTVADQLNVSVGAGDDIVMIDSLEFSDHSAAGYTIDGGAGANTLVSNSFDNISGTADFANVSNFQTLEITNDVSGSFDGVATGANATGIMTYVLNGQIDDDLALTNVNNDVVVDINGGTDGYAFDLSVDSAVTTDTAATINHNAAYSGSTDWIENLNTSNIQTLTINTNTSTEIANDSTLALDYLSSVDLVTLNITGDEYVEVYGDPSNLTALTAVNADTMTSDLYLNLSGVHHTNGITVNAGSGNDNITLGSGQITVSLGEGNNSLHADSGALDTVAGHGDVTVTAGDGVNNIIVGNSTGINRDTITVGNGGNTIHSASANSVIVTGSGADTVLVNNANVSNVSVGAGINTITFADASELTAGDIVTGAVHDLADGLGNGNWTTVAVGAGTLSTVDDNFFYQWTDIQEFDLRNTNSANTLTLNRIASDSGLEEVFMSNHGDTINIGNEFSAPLTVVLGNGNDTINVAATDHSFTGPSQLDVLALDYQLTSLDSLQGGNGSNDTLHISTDSSWADLSALVGGFEHVVMEQSTSASEYIENTGAVNAGDALTIDASAMANTYDVNNVMTSHSYFDLSLTNATTNNFTVTGADGENYIDLNNNTGSLTLDLSNSTVMGGVYENGLAVSNTFSDVVTNVGIDYSFDNYVSSQGSTNTVTLGDNNSEVYLYGTAANHVTGGNGDNYIYLDSGVINATDSVTLGDGNNQIDVYDASTIAVGNGNNSIAGSDAVDTITVGTGSNNIEGFLGADTINLAATRSTGAHDTIYYSTSADSSGVNTDVINNFIGGTGGDVINLNGVLAELQSAITAATGTSTATFAFLGNVSTEGQANAAFQTYDLASTTNATTALQAVYVSSEHMLYVDSNANGNIDSNDMTIQLNGVSTLTAANFTAALA